MPGPSGRLFDLLVEHGVPERAARVYLAACREGPQTASELARVCSLNRVDAYRYIRHLQGAGMLTASGGRPKRFEALPADALIDRWVRLGSEHVQRLQTDRERVLSDLKESLPEVDAVDGRGFTVLDGPTAIRRVVARRLGTARQEVRLAIPGSALALVVEGGIDRAIREAHERGVKVRLVTEVTGANRAEAKHFNSFTEMRHAAARIPNASIVFDHSGVIVYVTGPEGLAGGVSAPVALWSTRPSFRQMVLEYHRHQWARALPAAERLVELEGRGAAILAVPTGREIESFDRMGEIAKLGMRITGLAKLQIDLPEMIEAVARPMGRQIAEDIGGETRDGVARALVDYYAQHALGRLEIVKARPTTVRVTQCFACVRQSPEVGRVFCPALLRSVFEARLGGSCDVSKPDPRRHSERGCLFTVTSD
jgi:sugar-specific transcriptional regulator TrmB